MVIWSILAITIYGDYMVHVDQLTIDRLTNSMPSLAERRREERRREEKREEREERREERRREERRREERRERREERGERREKREDAPCTYEYYQYRGLQPSAGARAERKRSRRLLS